jgi:hypothetical protein
LKKKSKSNSASDSLSVLRHGYLYSTDLAETGLDQGKGMEKMALSVSESVLFEKPLPTPA